MPEVLTKYPDVVLRVLASGEARCGEGVAQRILTRCPRDQFCSFPRGELCVYGLDDIGKMTQIRVSELAERVCNPDSAAMSAYLSPDITGLVLVIALAVGFVLGRRRPTRSFDMARRNSDP